MDKEAIEIYKQGHSAGIKYANENYYWDPKLGSSGGANIKMPENFVHRSSLYACGFSEGVLYQLGEIKK